MGSRKGGHRKNFSGEFTLVLLQTRMLGIYIYSIVLSLAVPVAACSSSRGRMRKLPV